MYKGSLRRHVSSGTARTYPLASIAIASMPANVRFALYRQAQILARQGIVIDRSTLAFWAG
ncbi:MAG: hypothetical protein ACJ8AW_14895, partial [Rhodopila sp.]